ncbi:hypothetical protein M0208_06210 [Sphingomonas sp. SUN019]|uniref:hypothetical protein n=1 Tax=Sphingomonas sp. SUN019 TaxID=2937788 RepID=UPI00216459E8|nr:hypothetical protein [Sphingomonas sp. SUN019]UVO50130.1 hypothetical protein M0208_06210 [Sphingomonas sp. SUN019]
MKPSVGATSITAAPEARVDANDFVVIDVEIACSRVSSICQIAIVGFRNGQITFEYEALIDPSAMGEGFPLLQPAVWFHQIDDVWDSVA